eukprot:gene16984-19422_t
MVKKYKVTLIDEGVETVIECAENKYILDAAEEAGLIKNGSIDQKDQSFLDETQLAKGFALTCVSYPLSDVTVLTHQESNLF